MRWPFAALLGLLGTLLLGMWLGGHASSLPAPLRDLVADDQTAVIGEALDRVDRDYYRPLSERELADDAVRGIVGGLDDRFSAYFDAEEYARFREVSDARFSGVGMSVQRVDDGLRVVQVYDDSPAKKEGIRVGDVIVRVDDTSLAGKAEEAATGLIKGKAGTQVEMTVRRGDDRMRKRLTRAQVTIPVVSSRMVE